MCDTGAEVSVIDTEVASQMLGHTIDYRPIDLLLAGDGKIGTADGQFREPVQFDIGKNRTCTSKPLVMSLGDVEYEMILSLEDMEAMGITLSGLPSPVDLENGNSYDMATFSLYSDGAPLDETDYANIKEAIQDELQANEMIEISDWCTLANALVDFEVDQLKFDALGKRVHQHRNFVPHHWYPQTTDTVESWLEQGIIEKVDGEKSLINSPLISVPQYDASGELKKVRVCLDLRMLNSLITMDRFEVPTIREIVQRVGMKNYFSCIDLKSGYNQMQIVERCRKYLGFTWKNTQYRHVGAPFGLNFLPNWFHRHLSHLFDDLEGVFVYLDDILIATDDAAAHKELVKEVLRRLNKANLKINTAKCLFGVKECTFLGFKLSSKGIEIDPERQKRLLEIATPKTGSDLQSVLGAMGFVRDSIPNYGRIASPLFQLTKVKNLEENEKWLEVGFQAFCELREAMSSPLILKWPLKGEKMHLQTDASETGYGGMLYQIDPETGNPHIIQIFSGGFKGPQCNYSIPKKELFAIVFALKHLRWYLRGSRFQLYTDNISLTHLHTCELDKSAISKWFDVVSEFDFEITHVPRDKNTEADLLSKLCTDSLKDQRLSKTKWLRCIRWSSMLVNGYRDPDYAFGDKRSINLIRAKKRKCSKCSDHVDSSGVIGYENNIQSNPPARVSFYQLKKVERNRKVDSNYFKERSTCDWKLRTDLFQIAESRYGPHTIDLMAARHNAQLTRFCTRDEDAFTLDWSKENGWCNPPFHMIDSVLSQIVEQKATVTLCLPFWTKASWFSKWKGLTVEDPIVLPNDKDTFLRKGQEVVTNTPWMFTMITRVSGDPELHNSISDDFYIGLLNTVNENINRYGYKRNDYIKSVNTYAKSYNQTNPEEASAQLPEASDLWESITTTLNDAQDLDETCLTEQQKLEIAISYHNLTHSYPDYVEETMRSTGGFKWKDLADVVAKADSLCLHCELNRAVKKGVHPLKSIRGQFAGDKWVIDLIPLPEDIDNSKFILHILDVYSGFNILVATKAKSGYAIAEALYEVMCHHGYPRMMIHDRGNEFINAHVKDMLTVLANMLTRGGAPYHPQTQGSNERRHSLIRNLIKEQLYEYASGWVEALPTVMMKMNLKITRKLSSTPFAVYFGRTHNAFATNEGSSETWLERLDKIEKHVHPCIRKASDSYHDKMESAYNKRHRHRMAAYKPGSIVKMANLNSNGSNLENLYKGPYKILERVGDKHFNLVAVDGNEDIGIVNAYPVPVEQLAEWSRLDIIQREDDPTCEFDKILSHQITDAGVPQYEVRWKDKSTSWEYAGNFHDPSVLSRYHKRVERAQSRAASRSKSRAKGKRK